MKNLLILKGVTLFAALSFILSFFLAETITAQDSLVKKPQKVIKVTVNTGDDDETITIDTTFIIDDQVSKEAFEEAMAEYEEQMENLEKEFQEIEVNVDGFNWSSKDIPRLMKVFESGKMPRHMDCVRVNPSLKEMSWLSNCREPRIGVPHVRMIDRNRGETLSDVLGDIPMSAVKSYKIKETRNGKKIIIEVDDDYQDRHMERDLYIINEEPPLPPPPPDSPRLEREIFIEKEAPGKPDQD